MTLLSLTSLASLSPLHAQIITEEIPVGNLPEVMVVNPVTNKTYVVNTASNTVTIIDGATGNPTFLGVGVTPSAIAINTVTNKIYVADSGGVEVDVIDGATNAITPLIVGEHPKALAVNPVTNKVYVANSESDNLTIIDGATNTATTLATGTTPRAVAVNTVTNKIYIANWSSNNVTILDGATNAITTVAAGTNPRDIAVNRVTNQVYVANYGSNNVTDIDGNSNATTTIAAGTNPIGLGIDEVSNLIYVLDYASYAVTVIDGITNQTGSVFGNFESPGSIAVDTSRSWIYVANQSDVHSAHVDGEYVTRPVSQPNSIDNFIDMPGTPVSLAFNPVTGNLYVGNQSTNSFGTNNVAVLECTFCSATENVASLPGIPTSASVNPVTNKTYVANYVPVGGNSTQVSGYVSEIDGATNAVTNLNVGYTQSVAVNPVTNKIYASNYNVDQVTAIDGATHTTTAFGVGPNPSYIDINPATNTLYITNQGGGFGLQVTAVDGASNAILGNFRSLSGPVAINSVTNKIYAWSNLNGSTASGAIYEIDGATNTATIIPQTSGISNGKSGSLIVLAVNAATNKLYVAYNTPSYGIFTIDLATQAITESTNLGTNSPQGIAVNPITNKIYLTTWDSTVGLCHLMVSVGSINQASTVSIPCGTGVPSQPTVDAATNRIYFETEDPNYTFLSVYTVEGITNAVIGTNPVGGSGLPAVVGGLQNVGYATSNFTTLNPATHVVYHAYSPSTVGAQSPVVAVANPLTTTITPLTGNVTSSATPTFTFATHSSEAGAPPALKVYYQLDTEQGAWIPATGTAPSFTATLSSVPVGSHVLYYYATDGSDSTDLAVGATYVGAMSAYAFTVVSQ